MNHTILKSDIKIASFDIFDTVISRTVAEPRGVFDLLSHRISQYDLILPENFRNNFTSHRMKAERKARSASPKEDISLNEIYRFFSNEFKLPHPETAKLMALEICIELECAIGVPEVIDLIRFARVSGKRIIYISDMYLPKDVIIKMLEKVGVFYNSDNVYMSGDYGLTKASGRLFDYVLKMEKCLPFEMLHVGDHHSSDFKRPMSLGINAIHFNEANLNRYERALLSCKHRSHPVIHRQAVGGASRTARLSEGNNLNEIQKTIFNIGTNIAGPIIFFYALWVLREAINKNVKRLYFMARDGQVLLNVAQKISVKLGLNLELRYLYGSRQAWNLPSITKIGEDELSWITHAEPLLTTRLLSMRLGLPPDLLASNLSRAQFNVSGLDACLSTQDVSNLREIFLLNNQTQGLVLEHAATARSLLLAYLNQEKLTDGTPFAFIDTGWYANSQVRLKKILDISGCNLEMVGLYFGLRSKRTDVSQSSYFFDVESPPIYQDWGKAFISLFEALCSADHGMTMGYYYDEQGVVTPHLKEKTNKLAIDWGLKILRQGIERFIHSLPFNIYETNPNEYKDNLLEVIRLLISKPDLCEAHALGGFRFSSEQTEQAMTYLAPPLSMKQIMVGLFDRTGIKRRTLTFWPEASILRSDIFVRMLIPLWVVRPFMKLVGSKQKSL